MSATFTFPTIDLGALGAAFDDAVAADDSIVVEAAPLAEAPVAAAPEVAVGASAAPAEAAADAAPEAVAEPVQDDGYEARFEADYAERSKADIRALQSALDKRYAALQATHTEAAGDLQETRDYVAFLEAQLAEYDPDEAAKFRRNRESHRGNLSAKRQAKSRELDQRRAIRAQEFPKLYPGLDPDDPDLVRAFEKGDVELELALIRERLLAKDLAEAKRPAPAAVAKDERPATAAGAANKATPERDESGRFVAKAEATRALEAARGSDGMAVGRAGGFPQQPATTMEAARRQMQAGFARLGVPVSA